MWPKFFKALGRKKRHNIGDDGSLLKRSLNLLDLIAFGLGSTLGLGIHVLAGKVAYNMAGPAVILSFVVAGTASIFSAICYSEFSTRVPRAGSAYVYSYVGVGEFVAFSIGWDMMLEYIIGTAGLARGLSDYLDVMLDGNMSKALNESVPMNVSFLASYPDFLSFGVILILTAMLAYGLRESSYFNILCTFLNLITILIAFTAGALKADIKNWKIPKHEVPEGFGSGGFMPFGFAGVMFGAAKCFFGFIGFDGIATVAEEAKNPKRDIPLSIMLSILVSFFSYIGISTVLTLMVPYYEQSPQAPFPVAFDKINWQAIRWIVSIGAFFAIMTSLLGAIFPLPRVMYAMASDGLIFKFLSKVHSSRQTPIIATIIAGIMAALMSLAFEVGQLIDMMSIGTLSAYSIVAICVMVLRYKDENMEDPENVSIMRQLCNLNRFTDPNLLTSRIANGGIIVFFLICAIWCASSKIFAFVSIGGIITTCSCAIIAVISLIITAMQPATKIKMTFRAPGVPFVPAISIFFNLYLMAQLDVPTWVRYIVWMSIGYIVYYTYGIRNSEQRKLDEENEK